MRYLDPKNDLVFKKIFGEHPHLLKSFLNALLPFKEGQYIETLEYLLPEQVPEVPELKNSIVDVKCRDNNGRQFIVEMQMLWTDSFKSRVLFNASKAYVRQLGRGRRYEVLEPVYALSLVDDIFSKDDKFYHHYAIVDTEDKNSRLDGLEFIFIELPKFKPKTLSDKKMQVLWLRFMTEIKDQQEQVSEDFYNQKETKQALEILRESAFTIAELEYYDRVWDSISKERTLIGEKTDMAMQRGLERGIEQGLKQGIEQGIEQGRAEERKKTEQVQKEKAQAERKAKQAQKLLIKTLLENGKEISEIATITGLTEKQIKELKAFEQAPEPPKGDNA